MMVDPKECTDVCLDNILTPTFKSLSVDDQQEFKDYIKIEKETERWHLSDFTIDRHNKVIEEREVEPRFSNSLAAATHCK